MIKVNLLPVKRRKKAKPLPSFLILTIAVTVIIGVIMAFLVFFFNSRLSDRKSQFAANEKKIAELREKVKTVDDYEKRNKIFKERSGIIETLSKNKSIPVKILDEISSQMPNGIWMQTLSVSGLEKVDVSGYGFTNTEIVSFVDNIKSSTLFTEVYLLESKSTEIEKMPLYMFKLTFKIKV
ncbi:MAG: PilN domain-containing protein [Nitrospirae bacterium]|jgi:type IV pilus assembly protein PilN|nr:PilN domain-containing protein [Nitrospirota bacterium]